MMRRAFHLAILLAVLAPLSAQAQSLADQGEARARRFAQSLGGQVMLTNSGFGLGGHVRLAAGAVSAIGEFSIGAGKDAREVTFFDRFGRRDVLNKANYFLMVPVHVGIERRLFASQIEDDFRPFIMAVIGPTLGWEYPYFEDSNQNGFLDTGEKTYDSLSSLGKGRLRPGIGGTIALGAHFGRDRGLSQGVRIGYTFARFRDGIQLLEPGVKSPQRFFGTPSILFYFARFF